MKSAILFLVIVVIFGIFLYIRSRIMNKTIADYLKKNALVIDVRSKPEYNGGHFSSAVSLPIDQFEARIKEMAPDQNRPVIVYCHAGSRAAMAEGILRKNGYTQVINARGFEAMKKYEPR